MMENKKRPVGVWIVCGYTGYEIFGLLMGALSFLVLRSLPVDDPTIAAMKAIPPEGLLIGIMVVLMSIAGAIALYLLKRVAFPISLAALVLSIGASVYNLNHQPALIKSMQTPDSPLGPDFQIAMMVVGVVIGIGVKIAIAAYCFWLSKKNVLS